MPTKPVPKQFVLEKETARKIANKYGTPCYALSKKHFKSLLSEYLNALGNDWPNSEVAFAVKANTNFALLNIAQKIGCQFDIASEGELRALLEAKIDPKNCLYNGSNKSLENLRLSFESGVHTIVIDSLNEIEKIKILKDELNNCPDLLIRITPGVNPETLKQFSVGSEDTKFGLAIKSGFAEQAISKCLEYNLPLVGLHCHIGSQILNLSPYKDAVNKVCQFSKEISEKYKIKIKKMNLGGGLGVSYHEANKSPSVADLCKALTSVLSKYYKKNELVLTLEPGRSVSAEAGVTLYTIGDMKKVPINDTHRNFLIVDGGLSDNSEVFYCDFTALHIPQTERETSKTELEYRISGKHCESDTIIDSARFSSDVQVGDYIQVICTGAYNASLANNYNCFRRLPTVLIREDGSDILVERRETWDDLFVRQISFDDLI